MLWDTLSDWSGREITFSSVAKRNRTIHYCIYPCDEGGGWRCLGEKWMPFLLPLPSFLGPVIGYWFLFKHIYTPIWLPSYYTVHTNSRNRDEMLRVPARRTRDPSSNYGRGKRIFFSALRPDRLRYWREMAGYTGLKQTWTWKSNQLICCVIHNNIYNRQHPGTVTCECVLMCGCFGNTCSCIYCVLYCFVYVYLFWIVTSVRTTATEWKLNCSK